MKKERKTRKRVLEVSKPSKLYNNIFAYSCIPEYSTLLSYRLCPLRIFVVVLIRPSELIVYELRFFFVQNVCLFRILKRTFIIIQALNIYTKSINLIEVLQHINYERISLYFRRTHTN